MKIAQIRNWLNKASYYNKLEASYADKIAVEIQKFCDFEIKFCHYQPSDGYVLVYDSDEYTEVDLSVERAIELYSKLKRRITLDDLHNII